MSTFSTTFRERRNRNAKVFEQYGVKVAETADARYRIVHAGAGKTVFTIGYERRTGDDLIADLRDAGVSILIDVRDRPFSRKPDFRERALRRLCEDAKIDYQSWRELGSTEDQREKLKATGDFPKFAASFRSYAERNLATSLDRLAKLINDSPRSIALLCYERCHDECHRSILAKLLVEQHDVGVTAIG